MVCICRGITLCYMNDSCVICMAIKVTLGERAGKSCDVPDLLAISHARKSSQDPCHLSVEYNTLNHAHVQKFPSRVCQHCNRFNCKRAVVSAIL